MYELANLGDATPITYDLAQDVALIIAEPGPARDLAQRTALLAGFQMRAPLGAEAALQAMVLLDGVRLVIVETAGVDEALLEPLLARLGALVETCAVPMIATVLPEHIDAAAALLPHEVMLQCAPSEADRLSAALFVGREPVVRLHDGMRDEEVLRMRRFQEEVARIADSLARLTRSDLGEQKGLVRTPAFAFAAETEADAATPSEIRRVIRARRMRAEFFEGDLFADPAWDMLLDLFAADLEHRQISVSSLCIAAAVPPTTALRWIGTLSQAGLFDRRADPSDRRRAYIALSDAARHGMLRYIGAVKRAGLSLV
ncbi:hypothetical protein [Sphingomonas sp. R1]|uniref:hypothetical protein n=1 Tax=Sphingomonas sp. R1 TaxID=399176 RepID=UPI00222577EE|nr:hypothetical protein [Sphingomonas sp. R1]UYY76637.1 hypothetical protein OIM94_14130 [Sphingomonas sp. R1]